MITRLLVAAFLLLLPVAAAAHGEHGTAQPLGGRTLVTLQGYQVELLSQPSPLAVGQESKVVAKVFKNSPLAPVSGGRVFVGLVPPGAPADLQPAPEETWAGSYTVAFTPTRKGPHQVRVVLEEMEGRRFTPPLAADFEISVGRAPGMGAAVWVLLLLLGGVAVLGLYAVTVHAKTGGPAAGALNLLEIPWLHRLVTSSAFQLSLQIPLFLLTGLVVLLGLFDVQEGALNLATKLTWVLWWPGIIFSFILVGRLWCVACPFGALNEWVARVVKPTRMFPTFLRNLWLATLLFVILTWADEQLGVVRSPHMTVWLIALLALASAGVGIFWERRSFCRYVCPITGLQGLYAMVSPIELRADDHRRCLTACHQDCYRGNVKGVGCPMFEFPLSMERNTYCTLCFECVKTCPPDNLALRVRTFGKDLWASSRRVLDESYLAVVLVGLTLLVTAQMLTAWPGWISALSRWLPAGVRSTLKPVTYLGLVESVLLLGGALVGVPLVVCAGAALADRLAGAKRLGLRRAFVVFGYMFIPVGLALHLAHNLAHLLLEGGGIVPALQRAGALYTPLFLGEPDWQALSLAPAPVVGVLQMATLVGFFLLSLLAGHRLSLRVYSDPRTASRTLIPMAVLSFVFTVIGIVLLNQPMGMRHGM